MVQRAHTNQRDADRAQLFAQKPCYNEKEKRTMVKNVFKKLGKKQKNNKGFSLVELIVVIAIMAVLVGVLAPQLIKYVEKSRESTDIQNADSIATAIKTYYSDKETYPDNVTVTLTSAATPTFAAGDSQTTTALSDAGLDKTKLKGKNWSSIVITYTPGTGDIQYEVSYQTGKTEYYTTGGAGKTASQISPK